MPKTITIPKIKIVIMARTGFVCLLLGLALFDLGLAQTPPEISAAAKAEQLDSVIAVVNNQVILASDLELEMRIFRLLPIGERVDSTPAKALERLTTRALIEQQIVQEDPHGLDVSPRELIDSLAELRQSLPACKQRDCASAAGWAAYLATLGLTPERVSEYWARRMAVLRFIELRFRSGNRVTPEEIEKYYREQMVPKYAKPSDAPPLERLSPRIQEILLQQKVNALLGDWLKSLQDQGQVEVLDPALQPKAATADNQPPEKGGKP
jgi:parvulin-like peptidyl-prolyl isomerase